MSARFLSPHRDDWPPRRRCRPDPPRAPGWRSEPRARPRVHRRRPWPPSPDAPRQWRPGDDARLAGRDRSDRHRDRWSWSGTRGLEFRALRDGEIEPLDAFGEVVAAPGVDLRDAGCDGRSGDIDRGEAEQQARRDVERVVHPSRGPRYADDQRHDDGDDAEDDTNEPVAGMPAHDDEHPAVERDRGARVARREAARWRDRIQLLHRRAVAADDV